MKPYSLTFTIFGIFLVALCNRVHAHRPNVIVIYTDDQGSLDANCYGSTDLATPNLDRLADSGIRFTQMYAPSAICSASRAGLLTGRIPPRAGVPGNVSSKEGVPGMPTEELTLAELFKSAGYATGHIGKWHLGYTPETMPNGQGFDHSFGHMGGCIDNYSHFFFWNGPNRHDLWRNGKKIWADGQFFPDLMVRECRQFMDQHKSQPFFIYCAINVPHYPYQGTEKWRTRYEELETPRREYAAFVSTMDEKVGEILDALEELQLTESTIVVFQSDHGHSTEERAFFGGGNAGPYRGAKGCLFEGGIRVPSFISWPGHLPAGETRDQMVVGCDWFPTLAELAEIKLPAHHLDGESIVDVLHDAEAESPHEQFYWHLGGGKNPQWVVRQGPWKLLGNAADRSNTAELTNDDKKLFLANLSEDIGERNNLAKDHPDIVTEMLEIRRQYLESLQSTR